MDACAPEDSLHGKIIAVAGASCGVGYALARRLAEQHGAQVIAIGRRRLYRIEALSEHLGEESLWVCAGDMSVQSEAQDVVRRIMARFGHLDAYVHTIRRTMTFNALDITEHDFHLTMRINVKSALFGVQAVVPHLSRQRSGAILIYNPHLAQTHRTPAAAVTLAAGHALSALISGWADSLTHCGVSVHEVARYLGADGSSQTWDISDEHLLLEAITSAFQTPLPAATSFSTSKFSQPTVLSEHGGLTLTQF